MKHPHTELPVVSRPCLATPAAPISSERRRDLDATTLGPGIASCDDHDPPLDFLRRGRDLAGPRQARPAPQAEPLGLLLSLAPMVLWEVDTDGVLIFSGGGALPAMGAFGRSLTIGRSALDLYASVRVTEAGGVRTTGESLLRRALAGEPCSGVAEIGDARYETTLAPRRGPGDEVTGVIGVVTDVTERHRAEAHLLQTDRLTAVGTLAAGVAREIDTPLTAILRNLDFVSRLVRARADECRRVKSVSGSSMADTLEELGSALQFARTGSERVRRIAQDLATFASCEAEKRSLVDLRAVLGPVLTLVSPEIRKRARFVQDFRDVPLVDVNVARLGQVFMNLLVNAAQAIPEGAAESHEIGVATCTDEAGRAVFEVRDTGAGIPDEVVSRIFEPFFTTGQDGLRIGLGLSMCHALVTALGGEISVLTRPGAGSVFRVAIPAAPIFEVLAQPPARAIPP